MNHVKGLLSRNPHFTVLTFLTASTLIVLISILGGRFLSSNNLQSMGNQVAEFGLLALAMGLSMLLGGIDLSIVRSEEHTSELQSHGHLVCRLLLEKTNKKYSTF